MFYKLSGGPVAVSLDVKTFKKWKCFQRCLPSVLKVRLAEVLYTI